LKLDFHFSLVAAVFAYSLWQQSSRDRFIFEASAHHKDEPKIDLMFDNQQHHGYCRGTSKGFFLGTMSTVATLIVIVMYFLMKVCFKS